MGVVIHGVACSGLHERWVWEKIAKETYGQVYDLSDNSLLPKLVTTLAECDLDKQRVSEAVQQQVTAKQAQLAAIPDEGDRVSALLSLCELDSADGFTIKRKESAHSAVKKTQITRDDVEQAIASLRCAKVTSVLSLFPKVGVLTPADKGGLFDKKTQAAVPLQSVEASFEIVGFAAKIELTQQFTNKNAFPIEATYKFPVDDLAGVCGFVAEIDGKRIVAKCMPKEKAQQVYDDAVASGSGAYLLEQKKEDLFEMSVGNLPQGKTVVIRITYITLLECEEGVKRFFLPMTIAPRYAPPVLQQAPQERVEGPKAAHVGYRLQLHGVVKASEAVPVESITCPTHHVTITKQSPTETAIKLADPDTEMNADFVLLVKEAVGAQVSVIAEEWDPADEKNVGAGAESEIAVAAFFSPQLPDTMDPDFVGEIVALIDCSASMIGGPFQKAVEGLQEFVRLLEQLPKGVRFNIGRFGSDVRFLFSESRAASDAAVRRQAVEFVRIECATCDMGGSQLSNALKRIYNGGQLLACSKGHILQPTPLHRLLGDDVNYRFGFSCDKCKGCEGQPEHCSVCCYDLCRHCVQESMKKAAADAKQTTCPRGHSLALASKDTLEADCDAYKTGFVCDLCGTSCQPSAEQPMHCGKCRYDLCAKCRDRRSKCHVLLLTDAAVSGGDRLSKFVRENATNPVMAVGVGHGLNKHLLRKIAQESRGYAEFCTIEEDVVPRVRRQVRRICGTASQPRVTWSTPTVATPAPQTILPLIGGAALASFALVDAAKATEAVSATLQGAFLGKAFRVTGTAVRTRGSLLHRLCARALIRDAGEGGKELVVQLATRYSLASQYTSFVAVEEREDATVESMQHVPVPTEQPKRQKPVATATVSSAAPAAAPAAATAAATCFKYRRSSSRSEITCGAAPPPAARECKAAPPPPPAPCATRTYAMDDEMCCCLEDSILEKEECADVTLSKSFKKSKRKGGFPLTLGALCTGAAALFTSHQAAPCTAPPVQKAKTPQAEWEAFLLECGTSAGELLADAALADKVRQTVREYLLSHKLPVVEVAAGVFSLERLSSSERQELATLVACAVIGSRLV
eukprot:TRINITY_DN7916_c0_g1_i1.p1 TRINITY_DN7916_c0_g1~~TRINITY_DN7916_c0_g1_i1.p1  ORF type:complete len:1257 (-),score=266.49 TRINITY_DN7916_c0_g1_i1:1194-4448(-)